MARLSMLIDLTRCIGCDACTMACKQENGTPTDTFFARVVNIEAGKFPDVKRIYMPVLCNHCEEPACLKACPNKAIYKREDGIVLIDQDRCRGTGACVSACPYGNVVLSDHNAWYLHESEPYERDYVKPRLKEGVARKCTYCAHRVDDGMDPACVVACPTNARIFGDVENPESRISKYIAEQRAETGREPFKLLPQAGTKPGGMYLPTMAAQASSSTDQPQYSERPHRRTGVGVRLTTLVLVLALIFLAKIATAQFSNSTCTGCHGQTAMGGLGPPLARMKLPPDEFLKTVREGKGMMPATTEAALSDKDAQAIYEELKQKPWLEDQIPFAYKVGQMLSTRNVGHLFLVITLLSIIFTVRVLFIRLRNAGFGLLLPNLRKLGWGRVFGIAMKALFVDGFLVLSLWKNNKFRWMMHGLMIYGFVGLMLADILMQIYNPARSDLPLMNPLKLLPIISGVAVVTGIFYVQYRYRKDEYINNGVTVGRDFLFVNLLMHTILSGFLTVIINRTGQNVWVMPVYLYHLSCISLLILSAPFTRFQHVFVVPAMIMVTRLVEAVTAAGVDIGFQREPSPGRHHKTHRLATDLIQRLSPELAKDVKIRYYP